MFKTNHQSWMESHSRISNCQLMHSVQRADDFGTCPLRFGHHGSERILEAGSRPRWSMHTSWTTPQSDNINGLSWTVFAPDKVNAVPVRRNGNFHTTISVPVVIETQTMSHIVKSCPQTRLHGGLSKLHTAAVLSISYWLLIYFVTLLK